MTIKATVRLNDGFYEAHTFETMTQATEWATATQRLFWIKGIVWSRWVKASDKSFCSFYKDGRPFGELRLETT